jgi:hypothetical protein
MIGGLVLATQGEGIVDFKGALETSLDDYDPNAAEGTRPYDITQAWDLIQEDVSGVA